MFQFIKRLFKPRIRITVRGRPDGTTLVIHGRKVVGQLDPLLLPREDGLGFYLQGDEPHTILGPGGDYLRPKFD